MKTGSALFASLSLTFAIVAHADTLQLANGDLIHGRVVSIDDSVVRLESEILGEFALPRGKIVGIVFGEAKKPAIDPGIEIIEPPAPEYEDSSPAEGGGKKQETPAEIIKRLAAPDFGPKAVADLESKLGKTPANPNGPAEQTPEDVVRQLRAEGVDPRLMNELQLRLPGFASPEVQSYFNDTVGGLIDGSVSLQDIRDDAIDARDQLIDLKEDLGPDAAALDGYLGILEGFIRTTAPPGEEKPAPRAREARGKRSSRASPMSPTDEAPAITRPTGAPAYTPPFSPPPGLAPPMTTPMKTPMPMPEPPVP